MGQLIVAADLTALGAAAGDLAATFGAPASDAGAPDLGDPGAEDAMRGFAAAAGRRRQELADHGRAGSESLRGFALAFHNAAG